MGLLDLLYEGCCDIFNAARGYVEDHADDILSPNAIIGTVASAVSIAVGVKQLKLIDEQASMMAEQAAQADEQMQQLAHTVAEEILVALAEPADEKYNTTIGEDMSISNPSICWKANGDAWLLSWDTLYGNKSCRSHITLTNDEVSYFLYDREPVSLGVNELLELVTKIISDSKYINRINYGI